MCAAEQCLAAKARAALGCASAQPRKVALCRAGYVLAPAERLSCEEQKRSFQEGRFRLNAARGSSITALLTIWGHRWKDERRRRKFISHGLYCTEAGGSLLYHCSSLKKRWVGGEWGVVRMRRGRSIWDVHTDGIF